MKVAAEVAPPLRSYLVNNAAVVCTLLDSGLCGVDMWITAQKPQDYQDMWITAQKPH